MLTKWRYNRPTKFTQYITLPSRYDLVGLLLGNHNLCADYDHVARTVARQYAGGSQHLRAEMVTSSLIAHRRGRMLHNFETWDTLAVVEIGRTSKEPQGVHHAFTYRWDTDTREPAWSA